MLARMLANAAGGDAFPAIIFPNPPSRRMAEFPAFAGEEDRAGDGSLAVGIIGHHAP